MLVNKTGDFAPENHSNMDNYADNLTSEPFFPNVKSGDVILIYDLAVEKIHLRLTPQLKSRTFQNTLAGYRKPGEGAGELNPRFVQFEGVLCL